MSPNETVPMPPPRSSPARAPLGAVCVLIGSLAVAAAQARDVPGLYSAAVPVSDRSASELARGVSAALAQVMVKLTGARTSPGNPALKPLFARASKLMLSYAYEPAADGRGLMLRADFDEQVVAGEFTSRGVAIWGKERPDTLVWLIVDDGVERRIAGGDEPGQFGEVMLNRAAARGIPLLFPLVDIEESRALGAAGEWPGPATAALNLSQRYATPAVLVSYLRQAAPGLWEARWSAQVAADEFSWSQEGDLPELVIEEGVDALADALARHFADPSMLAAADRLTMTVLGVRSAEDYARLANYLSSLDTVGNLFVTGVDNQAIRFELTALGGRAALGRSIAFGQVLAPVPAAADTYQLRH